MAKGSMYYGDLIKGAGDVGASMVPTGMDTWTDIMKQSGDIVIKAVEEQRIKEEKEKAKREREKEKFNNKLLMPEHGTNFYNAVEDKVKAIRDAAVTAGVDGDGEKESKTNMQVQQVNAVVKNYQSMLDIHQENAKYCQGLEGRAIDPKRCISNNQSDADVLLRNRMVDGEGIEFRLLTESNNGVDGRHGTAGEMAYIWTIDGVEYNVDDFNNTVLYPQDSEKNHEKLLNDLKTEGSTKGDGNQYGTGDEGRKNLRAAIESRVKNDVLGVGTVAARNNLRHWLGDVNFQEHLLTHPDLMNLSYADLKDKNGNPLAVPGEGDGDGAWWANLDENDKKLIIAAVTDYKNENYNEEFSTEIAVDYITNQGFAIYKGEADALHHGINAHNRNEQTASTHGNTISDVELINEGKRITTENTFAESAQMDVDGTKRIVTRRQKQEIDRAFRDKDPQFQGTFGWLVRNDDGSYNRYYSQSHYNKLLTWNKKEREEKGSGGKYPLDPYGEEILKPINTNMTEKRLRQINIGSGKTAGGGQFDNLQ